MSDEDRRWLFLHAQRKHEAARLAVVQAEEAVVIAKRRLEEAGAALERHRANTIIDSPPGRVSGR
jgi:hypothetical protein